MHKYKTMIPYSLKCRKNTKSISQGVSKTNNNNVLYGVVKNQDLSTNKKQMDY